MKRALYLPSAIVLVALSSHAIGTRTHAEIGMRCIQDYLLGADAMLPGLGAMFKNNENCRILYRGCAFPDWGYGGVNPDAGEASHWQPFNRAWADVLASRHYAIPPDADGQKELAYFFGAICHDIADIPWHFGHGTDKSFLRMASEMDHLGHGETEMGVDLVRYTDHPMRHIGRLSNFVPFDTVMEAMQRAHLNVTSEQLQTGITREHLILWFGPLYARFTAGARRASMPWCMAHVEDYYYGGIRHDAEACAMWVRYWYADILGGHCLQQMPRYFDKIAPDSGYVPYLGVADTTLFERMPENNAGLESILEAGGPAGDRRAALVRFDLAGIATDKPFSRATLWLASAGPTEGAAAGPVPLSVAAAPGAWQEGKGLSDPYNGVTGSAGDGAKWSDFPAETPPNAIPATLEKTDVSQWMSVDVTPMVRNWLKDPGANNGFVVRGADNAAAVARFYSSQAFRADATGYCGGTRVAYRPMLILLP